MLVAGAVGLLVAMLALAPSVARATVNVEKQRPEDLEGLGGALELAGSATVGNVDAIVVEGEGRLYWTRAQHHVLLFGDGAFGSERSVLAGPPPPGPLVGAVFQWQNAASLFVGYGRDLSDSWRAEAQATIGFDRFLLLQRRTTVGPGVRWEAWDRERTDAHLGVGAILEQELSNGAYIVGEDPDRTRLRGSSYASLGWTPADTFSTLATVYVQPVLVDPSDLRLLVELDMSAPLTERVSVGLELEARLDTDPPRTVPGVPALARWNGRLQQTLELSF